MALPVLFAAGMKLLDMIDGSFRDFAYGWAFSRPVRKVYYNLAITGFSVVVAFVVGTIEIPGHVSNELHLGGFWGVFAGFNINVAGFDRRVIRRRLGRGAVHLAVRAHRTAVGERGGGPGAPGRTRPPAGLPRPRTDGRRRLVYLPWRRRMLRRSGDGTRRWRSRPLVDGLYQAEPRGFSWRKSPLGPPDFANRAKRADVVATRFNGEMGRLDKIDLSVSLRREKSEQKIARLQLRLLHLRLVSGGLLGSGELGPPLCVLFEGWDASGKGGAIKRLVGRIDPRHVAVAEFGVPSDEEKRHHFLWRFGESLPGWGEMSVFDRSWYGRVLVERVEKLVNAEEWRRAYDEINAFERGLVEEGMTLIKFWLHISDEEQKRRFEDRRDDPLRRWKLTDEDWRNRSKRAQYVEAVEDMLDKTDTSYAPWDLVAAESKHYARVVVLKTVIARMEEGMRRWGIEPPPSMGSDYDKQV